MNKKGQLTPAQEEGAIKKALGDIFARKGPTRILLIILVIIGGFVLYFVLSRLGLRLPLILPIIGVLALTIINPDLSSKIAFYWGLVPVFIALAMLGANPIIISAVILFFLIGLIFSKGVKGFMIIGMNVLIFWILTFTVPTWFQTGSRIGEAMQAQVDIAQQTIKDIMAVPGIVTEEIERGLILAKYDAEAGVIDENAKRPLGVFLQRNLQFERNVFAIPQQVEIFATLKAETFKLDEPITVEINCFEEKIISKKPAKEIRPAAKIELFNREQTEIDCIFDSTALGVGKHDLAMEASFNFITSAYRKMYFMEQEKMRSYTDRDPLDEFKITEKTTETKNTPGPISIGLRFGSTDASLIGISSQLQYGPALTLSVVNQWRGELKNISELVVTSPPGITIEDIDGYTTIQCAGCGPQECVCNVPKPLMEELLKQQPVRAGVRVFVLHTKITDQSALIGNSDLAIRNFKVTAKYTYKTKETFNVEVKGVPQI
ncbi:MAG TPA: hypothetical protein VI612_02905 [Candidatus Nanoarchaeia archaeon]|nr:hypothetical protein [Candidatus Nanoarchaeia archaeon]